MGEFNVQTSSEFCASIMQLVLFHSVSERRINNFFVRSTAIKDARTKVYTSSAKSTIKTTNQFLTSMAKNKSFALLTTAVCQET